MHVETEKRSLVFPHGSKPRRVEPFTGERCSFGAVAGQVVDLFYGFGGNLVEPFQSRFRVRSRSFCTHTQPHSHVHFFHCAKFPWELTVPNNFQENTVMARAQICSPSPDRHTLVGAKNICYRVGGHSPAEGAAGASELPEVRWDPGSPSSAPSVECHPFKLEQ